MSIVASGLEGLSSSGAMQEWGFQAGDAVELRGLSKLELNGQRGTVLPLEYPEQAKTLGRLAIILDASAKRLSLKPENLRKLPTLRARNGGDLGEAWAATLNEQGKSTVLPLRCPRAHGSLQAASAPKLSVMSWNLRHVSPEPANRELADASLAQQMSSLATPDVICTQEGLEGFDVFARAGYSKLISSAVKAMPLRNMCYGDERTLAAHPPASADKLVVNEIYVRAEGGPWEVVESGVEQISSDLTLSGDGGGVSGPLAVRSAVWARLRPRDALEGPTVFLVNAQFSAGDLEDPLFLGQLSQERRQQARAVAALFAARAAEGDLGLLVGAAAGPPIHAQAFQGALVDYFESVVLESPRVQEDAVSAGLRETSAIEQRFRAFVDGPREVLAQQGWVPADVPDDFLSSWVPCTLTEQAATSRSVPMSTARLPLTALRSDGRGVPKDSCATITTVTVQPEAVEATVATQGHGLVDLPILGFGTCFLPEDLKERVADKEFRKTADELTEEAVRAAIRHGVRLFETGNKQMNQQVVGRTLERAVSEGEVRRSELFLAGRISKCRDQAEVRREADLLLRELRVDCVDLLILDIPPERATEAWPWAEALVHEGLARFLAASNFELLGPKVCVELFRDFLVGLRVPPSVYVLEAHPFNTNDEMAECCRAAEIQVMAYSPLGAPHKMEAFMQVLTKSDARDMRPILKVPENPVLQDVGDRHGATAAQVALRWHLQRGHCVIPKSFDPDHIAQNVDLFDFMLSPQEMAILAGLHKGVRAERFLQQAHCQGRKALPRMTRDAQDACEAILAKIRGPGAGEGAGGAEQQMQAELAELYRVQEVKGKGKGRPVGPAALAGHASEKGGGKPMAVNGKGGPYLHKGPAAGKGFPPALDGAPE